jgi:hypothetical protein
MPVALVTFEASPEIRAALADGLAGAADLAFLAPLLGVARREEYAA